MTMKKTDLAKNKMIKASNAVKIASVPDRFGTGSGITDRKEQRKLDQAAGLVPFACKLPMTLIAHLHERAKEDGVSMNELLVNLLTTALEKPKAKATKKSDA
jgi:hypothetical protein